MFFKIGVLKNFAIFTRKHLCWSLFLTKLQTCGPATELKSNSSTGIFLRLLQNLKEHLFCKTSANGCFWNLMKVFLIHEIGWSFWTCHKKCILLCDFTNTNVIRLTNKRAQIACSTNNLVWCSKKWEPRCKKRKLVHEPGHVMSWIEDVACKK